ncbi:hypothetical protein BBH88_16885 [Planococcus antarcticus DSM 14505]|uniref:Peptidase S54 rhomboid domain-containing protein n=1 Tax=Planococcus antarcticus DSM 14505 TaxID=1185653 RepID=A0ABM6D872_9BACL|nr:hypothetical protein BBH88_16885 [Planococcus antarcticus DSM 14505]
MEESGQGDYSLQLLGLLVLCYEAGMLAQNTKVPTASLLGPVFLLMTFNLAAVAVPFMLGSFLHIVQLFIGIYIGMLLKKENLKLTKRLIFYSFFSSAVLIACTYGIIFIFQDLYG